MNFNPCDGVRYCDPNQGITPKESLSLDDSNGRVKDDFRGIFRGSFITEAPIRVDGRCEVRNDLRWQVSTQPETINPTSIFVNPRDCEGPSLHRESEFMPPNDVAAYEPCVQYHVVMFKFNIYTIATAGWNVYYKHGYRCNGSSIPVLVEARYRYKGEESVVGACVSMRCLLIIYILLYCFSSLSL